MYQKQVDDEPTQGYQPPPQEGGYQGGYQQGGGYQQEGGYQQPAPYNSGAPQGYAPPPPQDAGYQQGGYQGGYQQGGYQQQYGAAPQGYAPPQPQGYQGGGGYQGQPQGYYAPDAGYATGGPQYPPPDQQLDDGKFPEKTEYRDLIWAILFGAHLLAVLIILGVAGNAKEENKDPNPNSSSSSYSSDSGDFLPFSSMGKIFLVCIIGVVAAAGFAVFYISLLKKYAERIIRFTLYAAIGWCLILSIIGFARGVPAYGIIFLFFAIINALFFYFWRSRIPFATAVLTTVAHIIDTYPAPTYYAYASLFVQFLWVLLWVPTFALVQRYTSGSAGVLSVFLVFSFYWTSQVIKNVVHVTASGLVATWYFLSSQGMPGNPTQKAFKRATTSSFGSICLGSLVVAILKTLRQLVNSSRRGNNWLACIASCILGILDQLIQYFNMYAFTQVAIYGKTYCQAAKDTWKLVKSRGVDAIVNDNLISGVLVLGAIIGGVATAVVGGIVGIIAIPEYWAALAFVCFLIGTSLVMLTMEVVESGVCTIFVCFAMDPAALQRNSPELYNTFVTTYNGLSV